MLYIDPSSNKPLYKQIYEHIREEILSGKMDCGNRLPAIRTLAKELCVSRNTIENAYHQLEVEGYVYAVPGSGFIVSELEQNEIAVSKNESDKSKKARDWNEFTQNKLTYDFAYGSVRSDMFPLKIWKRYINEALNFLGSQKSFGYSRKQGEYMLRDVLADYLRKARGVHCKKEQIIVCSTLQHTLEIAASILKPDQYQLGMEEPGHIRTRIVFESRDYHIIPIPVTDTGIDINALYASRANLVYITPSHQFPYGSVMPIRNRQMILQWARDVDGYIIEDDYDSEFRYNSKPIPSLQSLDQDGRTIYLGSFSKSLSPGLRVSYMVLPEHLLFEYHRLYRGYHCSVPTAYQIALANFIADGAYEKHLRKMSMMCHKLYDTLIYELKRVFEKKVRIIHHNAGLHLLIQVKSPLSLNELLKLAEDVDVKIYATHEFWIDEAHCPDNLFILGFSSLTEEEIKEGVNRMFQAWFGEKTE